MKSKFKNILVKCIFVSDYNKENPDDNVLTLITNWGTLILFIQSEHELELEISSCGKYGMLRDLVERHCVIIPKKFIPLVERIVKQWKTPVSEETEGE